MKIKPNINIVSVQGYDCFDDDIPSERYIDEATALAKARNVGITSDRDVACVAISEEDVVVGAAWVSNDNENYTFDVAVSADHEGRGIGSMLTEYMISQRSDLLDANPDSTMLVHVISIGMQRILARRGFVVTQILDKTSVVMGPVDECVAVRVPFKFDDGPTP